MYLIYSWHVVFLYMFKFNLTTNEHDGFKLLTSADGEKEVKILEELIKLLVGKIEKIKVTVGHSEDWLLNPKCLQSIYNGSSWPAKASY